MALFKAALHLPLLPMAPSLPLLIVALCTANLTTVAFAENVDVQTVSASNPGKTASIPASLKKYEQELKDEPFSTFTDSGHDSVTAAAGGAAGTCTVAGYAVEVTVMEKSDGAKVKVQITIKQGGKAVGQPWKTELKDAHPLRVKVGEPKAPVIFFFTYNK